VARSVADTFESYELKSRGVESDLSSTLSESKRRELGLLLRVVSAVCSEPIAARFVNDIDQLISLGAIDGSPPLLMTHNSFGVLLARVAFEISLGRSAVDIVRSHATILLLAEIVRSIVCRGAG
jgi:hypothetical protein